MVEDNIKYVANADLDEILMPRDGSDNMMEFMRKRENGTINSFNFRMAIMMMGNSSEIPAVPQNIRNELEL
jgi:hypothetical protein